MYIVDAFTKISSQVGSECRQQEEVDALFAFAKAKISSVGGSEQKQFVGGWEVVISGFGMGELPPNGREWVCEDDKSNKIKS